MTHICVSDLTSIDSDYGLSPGQRQAIIRTNARILLVRPLGTNFSELLVESLIFSFKKMRLKVSSAKRRSFCLGLNELKWPFMANFCAVHGTLKFSMIGFGQEGKIVEITLRPDIWWYDAVCHEADPVCNGHTQLMFPFSDLGRPRVLSS